MAEHEKQQESSEGGHRGSGGGGHGAGGSGGHEEAHEGAPEWLISFADNVALMMGFFVILLAMNMAQKSVGGGGQRGTGAAPEDMDFVLAIRQAFNPIDMNSKNPAEAALRKHIRAKASEAERSRHPEDPGKGKESNAIRPTDLSTLGGTIDFEDESTTLTSKGQQRVQDIAAKIKGIRFIVEVRGHASPSETLRQAEKGIALGHARALVVARVLVAKGIRWEQLRISSSGDNERKKGRVYDESDRENQRVNVVPTNDPIPDYTDPPAEDAQAEPKNEASALAQPGPGGHE